MQKPSLQYGGGSAISNFDRPFLSVKMFC